VKEAKGARDAVIYMSVRDEGLELKRRARGLTISGGCLVAASAHSDSAYLCPTNRYIRPSGTGLST
jgi:hypothetical protein